MEMTDINERWEKTNKLMRGIVKVGVGVETDNLTTA